MRISKDVNVVGWSKEKEELQKKEDTVGVMLALNEGFMKKYLAKEGNDADSIYNLDEKDCDQIAKINIFLTSSRNTLDEKYKKIPRVKEMLFEIYKKYSINIEETSFDIPSISGKQRHKITRVMNGMNEPKKEFQEMM